MSFAPEKNKGTGVPLPQAAQATATNATLGALNEAVPDKVTTVAAAAGQAAGLAGSVQQMDTTALVSNATSVVSQVIPGKISQNLQKAQQAAGLVMGAGSLLSGAGTNIKTPGINGINGNIPFDQLDTATATRVAMSQQALNNNTTDSLVAAIGDMLTPQIKSSVHIGGKAITTILSIKITQEIGEHNMLELEFPAGEVHAPGSLMLDGGEKLLGEVAEVELYDQNGISQGRLQNLFVVADVRFKQEAGKEGVIVITGYAPTWILDGEPHYETFYKKNLKTIAQSVTKSLGQVQASLKADPTITGQLPFMCRFGESAWAFLKRVSAETGQWLYFNGKELIFGKPEAKQGAKIVYGQNCYDINMKLQARPVQRGYFDYEAENDRSIKAPANVYNGNAGFYNQVGFKKSKELFDTTLAVTAPGSVPAQDSTLQAIGKSKAQQAAAGMYYITGKSTVQELRVGLRVDLELVHSRQQASHGPIRIVKVLHEFDATGQYSNHFEAIPAASEVPPPIAYRRPLTFPVLAEVIDNNDGQGRVRVKFLGWQQEGIAETNLIRVLTPDAGGGSSKVATNRGLVTIPEVGDQVYCDFEWNNTSRPFVAGSVFHGKHGTGGGANNDTKSFTGKSGNTLIMHDSGAITVKDRSGSQHIVLDGKNGIKVSAAQKITLQVGEADGCIEINGKDITIKGLNIKVLGTDGSPSTLFDMQAKTTKVAADTEFTVTGSKNTITGTTNQIKGQNHICGGDTKIDGGNVFIN